MDDDELEDLDDDQLVDEADAEDIAEDVVDEEDW